jgi:hypothetical protein
MQPRPTTDAQSSAGGAPTVYVQVEGYLRAAGRGLEWAGIVDPEAARLARIVFRLAQRVAVDSGRLEPAA